MTTRTQQQMTTRTTPNQAKENLMTLFGGAQSASERARAGVAKAGVPDVSDGKQIAASFVRSLAAMWIGPALAAILRRRAGAPRARFDLGRGHLRDPLVMTRGDGGQ